MPDAQPAGAESPLTVADLRRLPAADPGPPHCACARLVCPGWESVTAPVAAPMLRRLGTLRAAGADEPTLDEWPGSHLWDARAPIAPAFYPYNRCEVWACTTCGCGFLQYTEYGGYYVDHRLRRIDPALVV